MCLLDQMDGPMPHTFGAPQPKNDEPQQDSLPPQSPSPGNPPPPYERGRFELHLPLPDVNDSEFDHRKFVSNMYRYLTYQLTVMTVALFVFTFDYSTRRSIARNLSIWWLSFNIFVVTLVLLGYYAEKRRLWPKASLTAFTLATTFCLGCTISSVRGYRSDDPSASFFYAAFISLVIVFGLTKFSIKAEEFTFKRSIHLMLAIAFVSFGVICMFEPYYTPVPALFGYVEAMIFCTYVIYYTQITMKRNLMNTASSPYRIDGSDNSQYIIACLDMYMDTASSLFKFVSTFFNLTLQESPAKKNLLGQGVVKA